MSPQVCWTSKTKSACVLYDTKGVLYPQNIQKELCLVDTPVCEIGSNNKYQLNSESKHQTNIHAFLSDNKQKCMISSASKVLDTSVSYMVPLAYCIDELTPSNLHSNDDSRNSVRDWFIHN